MPTIPSNKIPLIQPGQLFSSLTSDTYQVRWLTMDDPVYYEALNRPHADITVRQLILARSLDQISLRLSHQSLFPFLVQPQVVNGTTYANLPLSWIWDHHVSMPSKWENVRLGRIKRVSGSNTAGSAGDEYTGTLRLVFLGNEEGSTTEVALFQVDYDIDSTLSYQRSRLSIPTVTEESNPVDTSEAETIDGFITFATQDTTDTTVMDFLDNVPPPIDTTDGDSDGEFDTPAIYQIADAEAGGEGVSNDFTLVGMAHGTGLLVDSAFNALTPVDSTALNIVTSLNYPFDSSTTVQSSSHPGIVVPAGMFAEFDVVVPSPDEPSNDTSGTTQPVWMSKIVRDDTASETNTIQIRLATYAVDVASTAALEFAQLTLDPTMSPGDIVAIEPIENLFSTQSGEADWMQGFGEGHVTLSTKWGTTSGEIDSFFETIGAVTDNPPEVLFAQATGRISSWATSRVPSTIPTAGQSEALAGSLGTTLPPSDTNPYVVEGDQGAGTQVDFDSTSELSDSLRNNPDIERYGYTGSLAHRMVILKVDSTGENHDYATDILPRLRILLGRDPDYFDFWFDGTVLKFYIPGTGWVTT